MKRMIAKITRTMLTVLSGAMLSVGLPVLHAQTAGCSLSTGTAPTPFQGQGTIITQLPGFPAPPFPFSEVAVDFFDAAGNVSGRATVNLDGVVVEATVSGTYTMNLDCTGKLSLETSVGLLVNESFVVVRSGGLRLVDTDLYVVVSRTMEKMR